MTTPRVALYARVSKDDDVQDPENQLTPLRKYAKEQGYSIYREYPDCQTGKDVDRPEFQQMIRDARGHRFQIVLMTDVDRFARSTIHLHTEMKRLNDSNVKVCFINQPMANTDTPEGELLLGFLGVIAQFERRLISRRTKAGLARAIAQGKTLGRPPNHARTAEIARLRQEGLSPAEIGKQLGISRQGVKQRLRRARLQKGVKNQT
jgi:DNA invertase Pin-like site-specific DNA recombinase